MHLSVILIQVVFVVQLATSENSQKKRIRHKFQLPQAMSQ